MQFKVDNGLKALLLHNYSETNIYYILTHPGIYLACTREMKYNIDIYIMESEIRTDFSVLGMTNALK